MIINVQANQFRNRPVQAVGIPARDRNSEMSPALKQAMLSAVFVTVLITLAISQVIGWQVHRVENRRQLLQERADSLNSEQINLLARRAKLLSPGYIEAVAAVRLGLHAPDKGQVHRL